MFLNFGKSRLVKFLEGDASTNEGLYLRDILSFTNEQLEQEHHYIQWCFPLPKKSLYNIRAPKLTKQDILDICDSDVIKNNLIALFTKMMRFYDLNITTECFGFYKDVESLSWTYDFNNHNYLRLTRIIKCLNLCKMEKLAFNLYLALEYIYNNSKTANISQETLNYWRLAASNPTKLITNKMSGNTFNTINSLNIKFIIFADTHNTLTDDESLHNIVNRPYDICFLLGDHSYEDMKIITKYIDKSKIVGILGNHDDKDLYTSFDISCLHNKIMTINSLKISGINGCVKYKANQIGCTEEEGEALISELPKVDILLTHALPKNIDMRYINNKNIVHSGSSFINKYIYKNSPAIILSGHNHTLFFGEMTNGTKIYENYGAQYLELNVNK